MASPTKLERCGSCGGFAAAPARRCPHCQKPLRGALERLRLGALGGSIGGGAIAFTLMACYGMPPCDGGGYDCHYDDDAGQNDDPPDANRPDVQVAPPDAGTDAGDDDAGDDDAG
jgi:hypothetical protein